MDPELDADEPGARDSRLRARLIAPVTHFLKTETAGGTLLLAATLLALAWANGPLADNYVTFWSTPARAGGGSLAIDLDLRHWVNDGLMTLFFFVVGLEVKRELTHGELRDRRVAALPAMAAAGGALLPALIYALIASGSAAARGWAIPMATDIAFAVGVLALVAPRAPAGLKLFLLALAIFDDIIAIVVIAVFYGKGISLPWALVSAGLLAVIPAMRRFRVNRIAPYFVVGAVAWLAVLNSGIHAPLAGVLIALFAPAQEIEGRFIIEELEQAIHPWTSFLIVPVFALANAGVRLGAADISEAFSSPAPWAVAAGLLVGKILGISGTTALAVRLRVGRLPGGVRAAHVVGVAALGGIGFTVSLVVAALSFTEDGLLDAAKVGVLLGSLLSALVGVAVFRFVRDRPASAT